MNATPPRSDGDAPSRPRQWAEEFGVFANDATQRLGAFGRRLRIFNTHAAQWITTVSWRRLGAARLRGADRHRDRRRASPAWATTRCGSTRLRCASRSTSSIHSDGRNVHIQPSIGGKATRAIDVPIPDVPAARHRRRPRPPRPARRPPTAAASRRVAASCSRRTASAIVIDKDGVRVLEGEAAKRDAELEAAAARQERLARTGRARATTASRPGRHQGRRRGRPEAAPAISTRRRRPAMRQATRRVEAVADRRRPDAPRRSPTT